jgi:signal transduction histidine kinase
MYTSAEMHINGARMSAPHSTQPATQIDAPASTRFDARTAWRIAGHRKVLIAEPYSKDNQARLLSQIESLVAADRRKDESMALLLHELRSPLASIQNAMAVLRIRSTDETLQQRMHELVERQVRQIVLLTASLGQMSGPRLDNLQPQLRRIDLCSVLRRAAETVTPEFGDRQHQLEVDLPDSTVWILGDEGRLEQVFINLLSNASKYSDLCGAIMMSMRTCDGHAVVQVCDSGIGIAADAMPFIFDLFVRADTKAARMRPGLGIGLALVRSILDSHQATVAATSEGVGHGSEFTVRIKLET